MLGTFVVKFYVTMPDNFVQPIQITFFPHDGKNRLTRNILKPSAILDRKEHVENKVKSFMRI